MLPSPPIFSLRALGDRLISPISLFNESVNKPFTPGILPLDLLNLFLVTLVGFNTIAFFKPPIKLDNLNDLL